MKIYLILILSILIFTGCEPSAGNKLDMDFKDAKATDISTKYGTFRIKLPQCFVEIDDYNFSLTNEHRYECEDYNLYFSLDVLSKNELQQKTSGSASSCSEALIYIAQLRASDFYKISTGLPAKSYQSDGCQQYQLLQYGKWYQQNEKLLFSSSAMECKENFYIVQFICMKDDFNLLAKHFEIMLKSIKIL